MPYRENGWVQHQADAVLNQANPVSAQLYTVLDTTRDVRIISISAEITWAVTQPTPLEVILTIDGQTITFGQPNPITGGEYIAYALPSRAPNVQLFAIMASQTDWLAQKPFMFEGRSVKVEVRITWAVTQPTPLVCRVKYAKIP